MVKITNADGPDELYRKLKGELTEFMEKNKPFNVQGGWEGENGVEVSALVDFSAEDRDKGKYYVGNVSCRFADNPDKTKEELKESDALMEAAGAMARAIDSVFKAPRGLIHMPETSDIDVYMTIPIAFGRWETRNRVDFDRVEQEKKQKSKDKLNREIT